MHVVALKAKPLLLGGGCRSVYGGTLPRGVKVSIKILDMSALRMMGFIGEVSEMDMFFVPVFFEGIPMGTRMNTGAGFRDMLSTMRLIATFRR